MTPTEFNEILGLVEEKITLSNTNMRKAISSTTKLAITLRFLATGESHIKVCNFNSASIGAPLQN